MIDSYVELKRLAEFHEGGLLTDEEFERLQADTLRVSTQYDNPPSGLRFYLGALCLFGVIVAVWIAR